MYFFFLQISRIMLLLKFVFNKKSSKKTTFSTVLRQSCRIFCRNLRICNDRIINIKLRICDLRTGIPKKFADLRLRNEPKNLRICDLQTL
jgi:hypothetical protein